MTDGGHADRHGCDDDNEDVIDADFDMVDEEEDEGIGTLHTYRQDDMIKGEKLLHEDL